MRWLIDLRIKHKIALIGVTAIAGFCLYLAFNLFVTRANAERLEQIREVHFPVLELTNANLVLLDRIKQTLNQAASAAEIDLLEDADRHVAAMGRNFSRIAALDAGAERHMTRAQELLDTYYGHARPLTQEMMNSRLPADIGTSAEAMQSALAALEGVLQNFRTQRYALFTAAVDQAKRSASQAIGLGSVIGVLMLAIIAGLSYLVTNLVADSVTAMLASLREIAAGGGDLTRRLASRSADEFGELTSSFNRFLDRLQQIIGEVLGAARVIADKSREIARSNEDLSMRTETQASSLEETAASMEEMTSTVRENADNTRRASEMADSTQALAQAGGRNMDRIAAAMAEINASSNKIAEITGVIDAIAFQTSLLALNAAVEAAHAGDQGHGFAVVASEVRSLAQRAAASAREIKALIADSTAKVHQGTELVTQSMSSFEEIMRSARRMAEIVGEIAASSQEQVSGIEQVNRAVVEIDRATQENAEVVCRVAEASKSMEDQAQHLYRLLHAFKIESASVPDLPLADEEPAVSGAARPMLRAAF
ncbi:MAG TPA: methyl-accepting chemotaxis protein [Burkholderiales bacterium]